MLARPASGAAQQTHAVNLPRRSMSASPVFLLEKVVFFFTAVPGALRVRQSSRTLGCSWKAGFLTMNTCLLYNCSKEVRKNILNRELPNFENGFKERKN